MDGMAVNHRITDEATLVALYGESSPAALTKEINYLHPHYCAMIAASPFVVLATSGPGGLDVSPRGDPAGFVRSRTTARCCCRTGAATIVSTTCAT